MASSVMFSVGVVLPAAGCGQRMELSTPKQFCEVNGRPLICYTIDCFHRLPWIQHIVISTSKEHIELLKNLSSMFGFEKVTVVEGGTTRHRSIHAGVKALQRIAASTDVVVIHDAVRPFVSSDMLERIAAAAHNCGAAGVCRPLVSTVIARDAEQRLIESLDRSRYFNSEMPQAFQLSVISSAYDQCTSDDFDFGTECLLLAMKYSRVPAKILDGDADLWKVTYRKDLFSAEAVLKERLTKVKIVLGEHWPELADSITELLRSLHYQMDHQSSSPADSGDAQHANPNDINITVMLHTSLSKDIQEMDQKLRNYCGHATGLNSNTSNKNMCPEEHGSSTRHSCNKPADVQNSACQLNTSKAGNITQPHDAVQTLTPGLVSRKPEPSRYILPDVKTPLVNTTFVHIFVAATEAEMIAMHTDLSRTFLKLSRQCQQSGTLMYGLLTSVSIVLVIVIMSWL